MENAYMENAYMENAYMENAYMENAYMENAYMENAYMENAYMERVHGKHVHGKRVHGKRVHGKRVHGKRVQCSCVTLIKTWRFYWKSSCRPSDCVNDGQIMASVKDNRFTVDYVMFSTFIVFQHASRKSSRISNHLTLLSHARKIMPLLRDVRARVYVHACTCTRVRARV